MHLGVIHHVSMMDMEAATAEKIRSMTIDIEPIGYCCDLIPDEVGTFLMAAGEIGNFVAYLWESDEVLRV